MWELGTRGDVETSEIRTEGEGGTSGKIRSEMWQDGGDRRKQAGGGTLQAGGRCRPWSRTRWASTKAGLPWAIA